MFKIKKLWGHISGRRKKQFYLLLALMTVSSFVEIVSIGAVIPFLTILTAPDQIYQHQYMQPVINVLNISSADQLLLPLTILFIFLAIFAATVRLMLLYVLTRLSYAVGADLSVDIYNRTLYQPYSTHISRNSSEVINGIIVKSNAVTGAVLTPVLTLISSFFLIIFIVTALISIDPTVALIGTVVLGVLYLTIIKYTRKQLQQNSNIIAKLTTQVIKSLQEGMGGIRDVLIDGSQQFYCKLYRDADIRQRRAAGNNKFIAQSPRYLMEAIGMTFIAGLAYFMSFRDGGMAMAIPVLGALALGAQRLLPAMQQAYGSYSRIKGADSSLYDVLELLDQPLPGYANKPQTKTIMFKKDIVLDGINFKYGSNHPWVLKDINLKIEKGSRVGFIGKTGSGKSTLLDVIMGLLEPTENKLLIDGTVVTSENRRAWQLHIAHVPQNIYLADSTIEENIAFGLPKGSINRKLIEKAAKQAQISDTIESWPERYETFVGERGVRLSGGQRQRIGIARALYKQADVIIFDEATSALDNETEKAVMDAIEGLDGDLTILIIAHRLSTLDGCDSIINLDVDYNKR
jgi:ATP-binding cassette, subfamily B, bacterial PglK